MSQENCGELCRLLVWPGLTPDEPAREVLDHLALAFRLARELDRPDAIAFIGLELGRFLGGAGAKADGAKVLRIAAPAFRRIERNDFAAQVEALAAQWEADEKS